MQNDHLTSHTEQVHAAGQQVANQHTDAAGLASRYLSHLALASGGLHHQRVTAAVARYRDRWRPVVNELSDNIEALGTNTGSAAVTVAVADDEGTALLSDQTTVAQNQTSVLSRNPNAATYV
ncbi:hypothetical protein JQS43_08515 [Natronosporangium hydrolyticum]|uniref:Uncharacterized protein n=1 Tax=Natronosporangium hydrolyticum TaxID=2811111 RepID=A0A895YET1_9ACTN|nr:hypothetical protein [Natronosporangium hydrolyticum]QSB16317.1 hypothetical protein JQS43_08515 [Natronosporangium hydrolyticum]